MESGFSGLNKDDLVQVLSLTNVCSSAVTVNELHDGIIGFAGYLGFEFVLCVYMNTAYERSEPVHLVNLSNPVEWMAEYDRKGYVENDPVRIEMELRIAECRSCDYIPWDSYERELTPIELEIIERRKFWGLRYGCSLFCNSDRQSALFVMSFASRTTVPDERTHFMGRLVVPHVNRCRKRLELQSRIGALTQRERIVANWLARGKTNWEIARIVGISESTVKYHVAGILDRLDVRNRQDAVAILIAERYLY